MSKQSPKAQQSLPTRFDKNLAHNAHDFSIYEEDAALIRSIAVYISFTYQNDLFNFGRINPNHFCEVMGYNKTNLFRRVPNPAQLQLKANPPDGHVMDTVLENALFRMTTEPLVFTYPGKGFDGTETFTVRAVHILEEVKVHIDERNRKKRFYDYQAGEVFINNLSRYFVNIDIQALNALRRSHLQDLYLYLSNLKDNLRCKNESVATPNFDLLCSLANIRIVSAKDRKKKINASLHRINEIAGMNMKVEWAKKGRYYYQPRIIFLDNTQPVDQNKRSEMLVDAFNTRYSHEIIRLYNDSYLPTVPAMETPLSLNDWDADKSINREEKIQAFIRTYSQVFGKTINRRSPEVVNTFGLD